jgi:hypothetical protein
MTLVINWRNNKEAVSQGSLDTFHYSRTFYFLWFSGFFLMESERYRENITCVTASLKNQSAYCPAGPLTETTLLLSID